VSDSATASTPRRERDGGGTQRHRLAAAANGGVAKRAGWDAGAIRSKMFRHTYCAARLQTLDGGAPVGVYTVARELGHGSVAMVSRVYAHLGTVRHRAKVVEYRVAQHRKVLGERLRALEASGFGTTNGTARPSRVTPRRAVRAVSQGETAA